MAGTYVGASGEVTVAVGGGVNMLVGGSARSVALQPFSAQGTVGLKFSSVWRDWSLQLLHR